MLSKNGCSQLKETLLIKSWGDSKCGCVCELSCQRWINLLIPSLTALKLLISKSFPTSMSSKNLSKLLFSMKTSLNEIHRLSSVRREAWLFFDLKIILLSSCLNVNHRGKTTYVLMCWIKFRAIQISCRLNCPSN